MKSLFQKIKGTGQLAAPAGPRIALGAFGKHGGWDDHIPGIGVETEALAAIKQTLYVGGIGSQIDSGVWEKLEPEKGLAGFNHSFLVFQPGHVLFGQLWSSTDRKGRSKYPMVLCLDCAGISPGFILRELAPSLSDLRERCQATNSAEQVMADCGAAQERLRGLLNGRNTNIDLPTLEDRRRFLEHPQLGPDRLGLLRILHELGSVPAGAGSRGPQSGARQGGRSRQFRVPTATASPSDALLMWGAFLRSAIPSSAPLLLISRDNTDWVDVIVGEPSAADFFCLRASLKALPLATEIPYDLAPDAKARLAEVEAKFLNASAPEKPVAAAMAPSPALRNVEFPEGGAAKGGGFKWWMVLLAVVLIGAVAGGMWALKRGSNDSAAKKTDGNPPAPSTTATTAVASSAPKNPVASANSAPPETADTAAQSRQYDEATNAARAALTQGDYRKAGEQAQAAAKIRPGDAAADALLSEARQGLALADAADERTQKYVAAKKAATQALQRDNYDEAIKQAGVALAIKPKDPTALKIVASARQGIAQAEDAAARNVKYMGASNAAEQAFAAGRFEDATNQAALALTFKPGDSAASKLMADARQELDKKAAAQKHEQYETAMNAATSAFQHGDNDTAARQIEIAAGLEPGDAAAAKLKSQVVEAKDLAAAKTFFEQGDYDSAAKLCAAHPGAASLAQLSVSVRAEQQDLSDARQKFSSGDYSFIKTVQGRAYHDKPPFSDLLSQAGSEEKLLGDLQGRKQSNDWQTVKTKLGEPASASLTNKPPFRALKDWATTQSTAGQQKETLVSLDAEFQKYLVWFNVLKATDPHITNPEDRKEERQDGEIGGKKDDYLKRIAWLEDEYRKGGWLNQDDRQKNLDDLRDIVRHRE
ncbi:MAG TPA: hypothetical protein VG938_03970 [Verrucomicrobiae bacterium]|jgi:tetratricopeptide (TPR) repeat protein|nr:hypothetical protein [Verrucomicrobiae bacterium]